MTSEELTCTISAILHGRDRDTTMRFKDGRIIQREIVNGEHVTINEIDITEDVVNAIAQYINKEK